MKKDPFESSAMQALAQLRKEIGEMVEIDLLKIEEQIGEKLNAIGVELVAEAMKKKDMHGIIP